MSDKYGSDHSSGGGGGIPLRPALTSAMSSSYAGDEAMSPRSGPTKAVSINDEPEHISPMILSLDGPSKTFSAGVGKRMIGRSANSSSRLTLASQRSLEQLPEAAMPLEQIDEPLPRQDHNHHHRHNYRQHHEKLLKDITNWLQAEKTKRTTRKAGRKSGVTAKLPEAVTNHLGGRQRSGSQSSDSSNLSLEKLQKILEDNMSSFSHTPLSSTSPLIRPSASSSSSLHRAGSFIAAPRRRSSIKQLVRTVSSDTEYQEGDVMVPSCDAVLDNSKTLSYSGGASSSTTDLSGLKKKSEKERKVWIVFKNEILRLAHTLRLKGWRRVPLDSGEAIDVERLSGALTNAVYVVSPPKDLPVPSSSSQTGFAQLRPPPKLLLRIYGPQVEHLIDRENELGILRRLARKRIGPRLLGTFNNGRFEEFLESTTLTADDLRQPDTSKQIAKRMRELHEGVDLLEHERESGAFVWRNWDKWVDRCEYVIKHLDEQILTGNFGGGNRSKAEAWQERGLICGVEWPAFRAAIERYREFLVKRYGSEQQVRNKLVFAHNDTQYGNILRLKPSGASPLLLPSNTHKQLVVIDFEYASANTPGLEFANHFTEWCYNYHDPVSPHSCNHHHYPTPEEQRRFIRSYVNHRPQFNPRASATPTLTPKQTPLTGGAGSISEFLLDSRNPGTPGGVNTYDAEEAAREKEVERQVEELVTETRLWRVANSAQWVAWGIVQAKIPGLDDEDASSVTPSSTASPPTEANHSSTSPAPMTDPQTPNAKEQQEKHDHDQRPEEGHGEDEEEFDYLGYSQERALFFWGDVVGLGLVEREDLPEGLAEKMKILEY